MKRYLKDHIIFKGIDEKKIPEKYWNIVEIC
jgi:hypothetical protein